MRLREMIMRRTVQVSASRFFTTEVSFDVFADRNQSAACRIHVSLEGFEWFLYNRTASFNAILTSLFENSEHNEIRSRAQESQMTQERSSFVLGEL